LRDKSNVPRTFQAVSYIPFYNKPEGFICFIRAVDITSPVSKSNPCGLIRSLIDLIAFFTALSKSAVTAHLTLSFSNVFIKKD
jgi:hypothetical protein